jgi:hypothetical protein
MATVASAGATAAAAASRAAIAPTTTKCIRRIRCPIDHLIMNPLDTDQVNARIHTKDVAILTWLFPVANLQSIIHKRYEAEAFHELLSLDEVSQTSSTEGVPASAPTATIPVSVPTAPLAPGDKLGFATLIIGKNVPQHQGRFEKWLDPAPHPTLSLRISVLDRIHWQRSSWLAGSICNSLCWGRFPKAIFDIPLDWKNEVKIDAKFNSAENKFDHYNVSIPGHNFSITLQDTQKTLFEPTTPIVEGFLDNESALRQLALAREVNMPGLGNSVYRQTLWSTPCLPNIAEVTELKCGSLFQHYLGCVEPARREPVAAWLVDAVPETLIYSMEGHVEDENDPNSATTFGERSLVERVQKKAMNRYNDFRDDVRGKTYSDLGGKEMPR